LDDKAAGFIVSRGARNLAAASLTFQQQLTGRQGFVFKEKRPEHRLAPPLMKTFPESIVMLC
jgi:hypothetical protein